MYSTWNDRIFAILWEMNWFVQVKLFRKCCWFGCPGHLKTKTETQNIGMHMYRPDANMSMSIPTRCLAHIAYQHRASYSYCLPKLTIELPDSFNILTRTLDIKRIEYSLKCGPKGSVGIKIQDRFVHIIQIQTLWYIRWPFVKRNVKGATLLRVCLCAVCTHTHSSVSIVFIWCGRDELASSCTFDKKDIIWFTETETNSQFSTFCLPVYGTEWSYINLVSCKHTLYRSSNRIIKELWSITCDSISVVTIVHGINKGSHWLIWLAAVRLLSSIYRIDAPNLFLCIDINSTFFSSPAYNVTVLQCYTSISVFFFLFYFSG